MILKDIFFERETVCTQQLRSLMLAHESSFSNLKTNNPTKQTHPIKKYKASTLTESEARVSSFHVPPQ